MKKTNKKVNGRDVFLMLVLTAGLLIIWALPMFLRNDFPTPPCVVTVWNEGLPNEQVVEVCK